MQSNCDADIDIVSSAINIASQKQKSVAVVAEDTDVLIMLSFHLTSDMADTWFVSDKKIKSCNEQKKISIRSLQRKLGFNTCQLMPVIHSSGGCDTTSATYGLSKTKVFNTISKDQSLRPPALVLQNTQAESKEVIEAGLQLLVTLY